MGLLKQRPPPAIGIGEPNNLPPSWSRRGAAPDRPALRCGTARRAHAHGRAGAYDTVPARTREPRSPVPAAPAHAAGRPRRRNGNADGAGSGRGRGDGQLVTCIRAETTANDGKVGETLPCGPPATSERLRRRRTFCGLDKELRNWDGQCLGETIQNVDGRVFLSPLKTTNVGPIYTSIEGQPLLREAASHSDSPQVPSHQRAPFHALRRALCWLLNHWPYPVNYGELPVQFGHKSTNPSGADGHAGPGGR